MANFFDNRFVDTRALAWAGFVLLAIVYLFTIFDYATNIPFKDDFHQQLYTAISLDKGHGLVDALFRQHGVHRLFTTHVFTYLELSIFGQINLQNQLLLAIGFLITLALVVASFSESQHRPIVVLISALLLLSPMRDSTWVGGTTQYYCLILFSLLSIKWLYQIERPMYLLGSVLCMVLAVFSMIGGIVLPVIGVLYLASSRKLFSRAGMTWLLVGIVALAFYFKDFVRLKNQPSILYFLEEPEFSFEFTFRVLGNFFSNMVEAGLLIAFTIIVFIVFLYFVVLRSSVKHLFATPTTLAFICVLLIIATVVAGRVGYEEQAGANANRYYVYTKTLWLLGFIILLQLGVVSKQLAAFILGVTTLYYLAQYKQIVPALEHRQQLQNQAMIDYLARGSPDGFSFRTNQKEAGRYVKSAMVRGIYQPDLLPTPTREVKSLRYGDFIDGLEASLVQSKTLGQYRYIAFTVAAPTNIHETVLVPRGVRGPATLLQAAREVAQSRLSEAEIEKVGPNIDVYEVIIDLTDYDENLTYDILLISMGKITNIDTLK